MRIAPGVVIAALAVAGCGSVSTDLDAPCNCIDARSGDAGVPGAFLWQQNMFGSFPGVSLFDDEPYAGASMFAALDLGGGILVPAGGQDVLVAHFDRGGAHRWSWRHGGLDNEFHVGVSVDPFGAPAVVGLYQGTGNAGGGDLPATASFAGFAAAYTPAGDLTWQVPLNATGELFPRSASTNGGGYVAAGGSFVGDMTVAGNTRSSAGGRDAFYVRINDAGVLANFVTFGGTGDDTGNAALFDVNGSVILVGTFSGQVAFGSFMLDAGAGRDLFVVRMSPQGVPMWAINGGGTQDVGELVNAAVTPSGGVVIADEYAGTFQMTGGQMVTAVGSTDIAIVEVSSAGAVAWTRSYGGPGQDRGRHVAVGPAGDVALAGEFNGTATFGGQSFTSEGFIDGVVAKYDANGNHVWSRPNGSAADDRGLGVAVDASGAVYYTASFHNTVSFGGAPLTASGTDFNGVLVKYAP